MVYGRDAQGLWHIVLNSSRTHCDVTKRQLDKIVDVPRYDGGVCVLCTYDFQRRESLAAKKKTKKMASTHYEPRFKFEDI